MRYLLFVLVCAGFLTGCANTYKPTEYPLRDGLIPAFTYSGTAVVSNAQPSTEKIIVMSYMGSKWDSDLNSITETMVQQAQKELEKNGEKTASPGEKSIALKVNSIQTEYSYAFYWDSNIDFQAILGDGQTLDFSVPHRSGDPNQDLNGCIADGVWKLFQDERVLAYLAI